MSLRTRSIAFSAIIAGSYAICATIAAWTFWFPPAYTALATPLLYVIVSARSARNGNGLISAISSGVAYAVASSIGRWITGFNDVSGFITSLLLHSTIAAICGGLAVSICAGAKSRSGIIMTATAIGTICTLLAIPVAWLYMPLFHKPFDDHRFDRDIWLQDSGTMNPSSLRASMIGDLEHRIIHPGMSRTEVTAVLGKPDREMRTDRYEYAIGGWTGFGVNDDSFDVLFDAQGRVTETMVHQH